jgi:CheY-like chemotaxis protein
VGYGTLDEPTAKRMKSIESAARKAAAMVSTLLNFSRKEKFHMFPLNLNDIVHEATKFLEGVIDKRIGKKLDLGDIPSIEGDQNRLEQIILNIIMNARDAMPNGGLITLKTSEIRIEKDRFDMPTYMLPGSYILLSISDTGVGILPDILSRIFEPFFTTKERGQGTGLGLSLVYRTVKDHKGYITVQSEMSKGSTFFIYLPVAGKDLDRSVQPEIAFSPATKNILVIDDEEEVLELVKDILETHGYRVLHTINPLSALDIAKNFINDLHLVITDIMMPLMNGKELAENLKAIKPDIRIMAISAYSDDAFDKNSVPVDAFLPKPFEAAELLSSVEKVLGAKVKNFPPSFPDVSA